MNRSSRAERWTALTPAAVFVAALALYTWTLHSDVQSADSGEFQIAALLLGIPHPPGYPLFTLLAWLFSQLPLPISWFGRVSWLSVVSAALTLAVVARVILELSPQRRAVMAAVAAALVIGGSTTFWAQATTTNIRSLTALFTALMAWVSVRAWREPAPARLREFALVAGLAIGHHVSLVFIGGVLGAWLLVRLWHQRALSLREWLVALLICAATQTVWLYLPWRDAAGARFAPGNLGTLEGLLFHVLARGFASDMLAFVAPDALSERLALLPTLLNFQFSLPVLIGIALAWAALLVRLPALGAVWLGAWALHLFITITYRAPQTVEYALPSWVLMGVACGAGASLVLLQPKHRPMTMLAVLVLAGLAARDGWDRSLSYRWLAADRSARERAEQTLQAAPPGAAIFAQWHQATPLWALQDIEGLRRDVRVVYVFPRGAQPYAETFAQRLKESVASHPTCATSYFETEFRAQQLDLRPVPAAPMWCALSGAEDVPARAVTFENGLRAWVTLPVTHAQVGDALWLDVRWQGSSAHEMLSLTVRFLRPEGRLASQADVRLDGKPSGARRVMLGVPLDLPPGDYTIWVGAYPSDAPAQLVPVAGTSSPFAAVAAVRIAPATLPPATLQPLVSIQRDDQPRLIGVDYDNSIPSQTRVWTHWQLGAHTQTITLTDATGAPLAVPQTLPARPTGEPAFLSLAFDVPPSAPLRVQPLGVNLPTATADQRYAPFAGGIVLVGVRAARSGSTTHLTLRWLAARPIVDDYVVSARVIGTGIYQTHDSVPALGAIPTLKWIRGSQVDDPHPFHLEMPTSALRAEVVVYDSVTQIALPLMDERHEQHLTLSLP